MTTEFANETDAQRYTMHVDGQLVSVVDYRISGDSISFPRTFTTPPFRGKGYAGELVTYAVDDVEQHSERRIVPMCWYVGEWFDAHPERQDLFTRSAS
ncbi:N-acetyltransferase [Plantibacter sp. VKM Ac-2880]|uniref:GNAT family N-acetyltransferase n=1 Tax=Plantibacter sp. VKM Ac-2880 TaxID=2783827 RepID=UPI00188EDEA0|nr:GNAT family N-acetyltransferase [Plantibacter sp. VKM Ac-2880]MBF4570602.1 N-acetyltransferase [Plantibacter sp. VKM Ac-2880]